MYVIKKMEEARLKLSRKKKTFDIVSLMGGTRG